MSGPAKNVNASDLDDVMRHAKTSSEVVTDDITAEYKKSAEFR